jgi:hypothetical protein
LVAGERRPTPIAAKTHRLNVRVPHLSHQPFFSYGRRHDPAAHFTSKTSAKSQRTEIELKSDRLHVVIDDVKPPLICRLTVRPKVADGAAVQQLPGFAVGVNPPAADNAGIKEIEALVAGPIDLPVLLVDQHRLALVDGDLRWADLDFDRHSLLRCLAVSKGAALASLNDRHGGAE